MAGLMDYVDYLSGQIGPRPAGTEEEQQAALYITEAFQKDTGFPTVIEDFTSSSNISGIKAICAGVTLVASLMAMVFPILSLPAFILALAAAAIYCLEAVGKPFVSKALARAASQNVLAKYQPGPQDSSARRSRKIVLVAHYDTGKVEPGFFKMLEGFGLPLGFICMAAMGLAALLLLIRMLFFNGAGGIGIVVFNIINILALLVVAIPVVRAIMYHFAPYNEGANNNASGVAALLEVARRISAGQVSEADLASGAVAIHGEEEARERGLVPEGAQLVYEASQIMPNLKEPSEEERLASAKAALAAFTGVPGARWEPTDISGNLVASRYQAQAAPAAEAELPAEPAQKPALSLSESLTEPIVLTRPDEQAEAVAERPEAEEPAASAAPAENLQAEAVAEPAEVAVAEEPIEEAPHEPTVEEEAAASNLPSWFVSAQRKARRTESAVEDVRRSRFSGTLDATEKTIAERDQAIREEQERVAREEAALRVREAAAAYSAANGLVAEDQPEEEPVAEAVETTEAGAEAEPSISEEAAAPENTQGYVEHDPLNRLFGLPDITKPAPAGQPQADESPSRSGMIRKMRADIPSLDEPVEAASEAAAAEAAPFDLSTEETVAFVPVADEQPTVALEAPATEPVAYESGDALADYHAALDAFDARMRDEEVSARERAERVERRRAARASQRETHREAAEQKQSLFGSLFHRKPKEERLEQTPQEWLDVDDDFDPREEGRKRGGWESFRDADYDDYDAPEYDEAFDDADDPDERTWYGGGYSRVRLGYADTYSDELSDSQSLPPVAPETLEAAAEVAELEQIYHFRNPYFTTEVWFAAIGSEVDTHDGAAAFIAQHRSELRGALIVDVESLGAGTLTLVEEEGLYKPTTVSSRAKRYTQKATESTGIELARGTLKYEDSIASVASNGGYQAMHIVGVEDGKIALKGSRDDVVENIDADLLEENVEFLVELVRRF